MSGLTPYLCSVHTHATCCDGKDTLEAMMAAACDAGVKYFGASCHSQTPIVYDEGFVLPADPADYRRQVLALREACRNLGTWKLQDCTLVVTLEPCPMCAGAIINARIRRVFYGARDSAMGGCGGVLNLFMEDFPHHPQLTGGIMAEECAAVLGDFFRRLRRDQRPHGHTDRTFGACRHPKARRTPRLPP